MVAVPGKRRGRSVAQMRRPGFSLAEVLIVITVLGILAGLAFPAVSRSIDQTRIDRAAFLLSGDLEYAFTLAARLQSPVKVVVNGAERSYTIRNRATNGVLVERHLGDATAYNLNSLSASPMSVDVFPNGLAAGETTYVLQTSFNTRMVKLSRAGQVRVN